MSVAKECSYMSTDMTKAPECQLWGIDFSFKIVYAECS